MIRSYLYPTLETDQEQANYFKHKNRLKEIEAIINKLGCEELELQGAQKDEYGFVVVKLRTYSGLLLGYKIKFHPSNPNQFMILSGRGEVVDQKTANDSDSSSKKVDLPVPKKAIESMIQKLASQKFEFQFLRSDPDLDGFILANLRTSQDVLDYSIKFHPKHLNQFIIVNRKASDTTSRALDAPQHPSLTIDTNV